MRPGDGSILLLKSRLRLSRPRQRAKGDAVGTSHPVVDTLSSALPLPSLTVQEVANQTDSGSYSRGRDYRRREAIREPVRRGRSLSALCHGSEPEPYSVRATLADPSARGQKIVSYS